MEHNNLTSIACARPVIYAEGLFASCYLDQGKFVPEEGLNQTDLWSILNGEFLKAGSDLVEDFTLKGKLQKLSAVTSDTFELANFPSTDFRSNRTSYDDLSFDAKTENIAVVRISMSDEAVHFIGLDESPRREGQDEMRKTFEKQVAWLMGDEGEDFVTMERFTKHTDALVLLDVLKQYNVPAVVSFLARRDEPIAVTFSKIKIDLDCLMFCLFQA